MNEPHDGLVCKKEGFFVAGFETPGQYQQLRGQYIPLSRAICCRPCLSPETSTLPGVAGNVSAADVVAIASDCQASSKAAAGSAAEIKGQECPADSFMQGFQHDVRANPSSSVADQYYYPVDHAQCCSPRLLLLKGGEELPVERCHCTQQSAPYAVGCGAANTPESAAAAGSLVYAFDNELTAMGAYGRSLEVPVTPVRCCKACVSPNAKPAMDDCAALNFCRGNGDCTIDGHCECNDGWVGPDCGREDGDGDPMHQTMWNAAKIAAGILLGCCARYPLMRCLGLTRRRTRGAGELEEALLAANRADAEGNRRENDYDFEASDLSTSDDGGDDDDDDDGDGDETEGEGEDGEAPAAREEGAAGEGGEATTGEGEEGVAGAGDGDGRTGDGGEVQEATTRDSGDAAAAAEAGGEEELKDVATFDVDGSETVNGGDASCSGGGRGGAGARAQSMECTVCMSARVQVVLVPCGHACMCRKCSRRLRRCPICRTIVERRQKLYIGL
jgi:hypothetical protein